MSLEMFIDGKSSGESSSTIQEDADRLLSRIVAGRKRTDELRRAGEGGSSYEFKELETECVLSVLAGDWGIYGVGVTSIPADDAASHHAEKSQASRLARTLLVHPLWLARDVADQGVETPFISAQQATWALPRLQDLFHGQEDLSGYLLQASSAPEPLRVVSGDGTKSSSSTGTLGPLAMWWTTERGVVVPPDQALPYSRVTGFVTAGHVTGDSTRRSLTIRDSAGASHQATLAAVIEPPSYSTIQSGQNVRGDVDAALVSLPSSLLLTGVGTGSGSATADSFVEKRGARTNYTQGVATNYMVWCGSASDVWSDCYGIVIAPIHEHLYRSFANHGDSGAAVVGSSGKVVGIVVGGARRFSGCPQSVSYVQDIQAIEQRMLCAVVPKL